MRMSRVPIWTLSAVLLVSIAALPSPDLQKLDAVWGKQMTAAEYLSQVDPAATASLPAAVRSAPVNWGRQGRVVLRQARSVTASLAGALGAVADDGIGNGVDVKLIFVTEYMIFWSRTASFGGTLDTEPHYPVLPYVYMSATLYRNSATASRKSTTKFNIYRTEELEGSFTMPMTPANYRNVLEYYILSPAGYLPEVVFGVIDSGDYWVDP